MKYIIQDNVIIIDEDKEFNIKDILECGQVFRYKKTSFGYVVYSLCHKAEVYVHKVGTKIVCDDVKYFEKYFDFCTDYAKIKSALSVYPILNNAIKSGEGIRILRQDPLEMIISFIISANNNIPRIKTIIEKICVSYGKNMGDYYAFPTLDEMKNIPLEFFRDIKCGYRDKYLYNTIQAISGGFDINKIYSMDTNEARKYLSTLMGVGPKVADCILLFGYHKTDVFPTDTWIKKVYWEDFGGSEKNPILITKYFLNLFGDNAGYAQQYLFYSKREE